MARSVQLTRSLKRRITESAKEAYPLEDFAILLGVVTDSYFKIGDIYYPANRLDKATENSVKVDLGWYEEARKYARGSNYYVIGDVHSHPMTDDYDIDLAPSECDWQGSGQDWLMGICTVRENRKTTKKRGYFSWWTGNPRLRERIR
jgi:proteasome lid subunit RPN8/RPN11